MSGLIGVAFASHETLIFDDCAVAEYRAGSSRELDSGEFLVNATPSTRVTASSMSRNARRMIRSKAALSGSSSSTGTRTSNQPSTRADRCCAPILILGNEVIVGDSTRTSRKSPSPVGGLTLS